ncbi:MAG: PCRF domain-containing protein [bacterium]|nr:PCRF domain-containing protein [bacterium]
MTQEEIDKEYQQILEELGDPEIVSDSERFEGLLKRKSQLDRVLKEEATLEELKKQIAENQAILSAGEDQELLSLAVEDSRILRKRQKVLEDDLESLFREMEEVKKDSSLSSAAIIEIRAGVGGKEAALFADDLFSMYSSFARLQNWQEKILDSSSTELGGLKEIIFELRPSSKKQGENDVFGKMKHEAGVHRVQRIPETEKSGRVHTSTATVAVFKKPRGTGDFKINPGEMKIDFFNATGPGGQNVNKRKTAVRITHLPSGTVITSRAERSQLQNKENALAILAARLSEQKMLAEEASLSGTRKSQIGWAKRAEKIRTYNFPQDRLTDHRIKKSWHHLEGIMEGKIAPIIDELQKADSE